MSVTATRPRTQAPTTDPRPASRRSRAALVWAGLVVLLVVVVFANRWGQLTPDTKPELYLAPWRTLLRELSTWRSDPNLGAPNYHLGFAPVVAVVAAIRSLGASPWVAERVLRAALLLTAGWGAARFVRDLTGDRRSLVVPLTAAVVFTANPYTVVSGATLPVLLPYAFLPWLALAYRGALRSGRWRPAGGFALAVAAMGGMNAGVVPIFLLLALPAVAGYGWLTGDVDGRRVLAATLRCGVLAGGVSLYWLVPTLLAAGGGRRSRPSPRPRRRSGRCPRTPRSYACSACGPSTARSSGACSPRRTSRTCAHRS